MSLYRRIRSSMGVVLLMSWFWHVGCGSEAAHPDASLQPDGPGAAEPGAAVSLGLDLSSYFLLEVPAGAAVIAAQHAVRGTLTAAPSTGGPSLVFDWAVILDETGWSVQSGKTIVLAPGTYQFTLILDDGNHRYIGQSLATVQQGDNRVAMTIRPVLGELSIQPGVTELPVFRLRYPSEQLASLSNPRLGVVIDEGSEQIVGLNPATGLSDMYISLPDGAHRIQLRLYDGSLQRGRSMSAQEAVVVRNGEDLLMDIVPLYGETAFDIIEEGGQLRIHIQVPDAILEEVGGLDALAARFSFVCPDATPVERLLELALAGSGDYQAELVLDGVQYGACTYSLTFFDLSASPEEQVASCSAAVELGRDDQSVVCDLLLRRRALVGGEILAVVGLNVLDSEWAPVAGAVVSDSARVLGITGAGDFGPPGYLKLHLPAGTHRLTALHMDPMRFGQTSLAVAPLEIRNIDIQLVQATTACSNTGMCLQPSFVPATDCQGFEDVCDLSGTQAGETTTYTCITGGCIPETAAAVQACVRDTDGVSCADTELGAWSECGIFSDSCDESGARSRPRTDHVCSTGACTALASTDTEACARDTDSTSCGTTTYSGWSACTFDNTVCDETGTQSRSVTEFVCAGASCTTITSTQTQACTRDTDSTTCGTASYGTWSACTFESDVCDETGTQSRSVTEFVCASASCTTVTSTQTQACTRDTDSTSCGTSTYGGWSACGFDSGVCDTTGTQSRTVTDRVCAGASCTAINRTETQACTRAPTDCGGPSYGSWGACVNEGSACDSSGTQSRTVTDYECAGDACVPISWTESQPCYIPPLECGGFVYGNWGACEFDGDVCDTTGTQTRPVTLSYCAGNGCAQSSWTEIQSCWRGAPGQCAPTSLEDWSECNYSGECDEYATRSRTVTLYLCAGDSCNGSSFTETQYCSRETDGGACASYGTCSGGICRGPCSECPPDWHCCGTIGCYPPGLDCPEQTGAALP